MSYVASTGSKPKGPMAISSLQKGLLHFSQWEEIKHQYVSQESAEFAWQRPAALVNALDTEEAD